MIAEILFDVSSYLVAGTLFIIILLSNETCYRLGKRHHSKADEELKKQTIAIQAGVLGLLAFLLGFTFHISLQRFDERSENVVNESNAIGTALLRAKLLNPPYDSIAHNLLTRYLDLRIKISSVALKNTEERKALDMETEGIEKLLWESTTEAAKSDPRPVIAGYYVASINHLIDERSHRMELQQRHVPEIVLFILFLVFIIGGGFMGYTSGLSMKRAYFPMLMFNLLIVVVVFIIIDMDRPKRGLIKVNQNSLIELKETNLY